MAQVPNYHSIDSSSRVIIFHWLEIIAILLIIAGLVWFGVYQYNNNNSLREKVTELQQSLTISDNEKTELENDYEDRLNTLQDEYDDIYEELLSKMDDLEAEQRRREDLEENLEDLADQVALQEKLSKIDKEILKKYDKAVFLDEHYVPSSLSRIADKYIFPINGQIRDLTFQSDSLYFLEKMMDAARKKKIDIFVTSAYRRYNEQTSLNSAYKVTYGAGKAGSFSAEQGYSEHQLGTTIDFTNTADAGQLNTSFDSSTTFEWLWANAHKYGFILSYPEDNQFYVYEPWHWRFVGIELATELYNRNDSKRKFLYDLSQTEIDKYLITIFDK